MYNIWQFQRTIPDDCTCSLTEQNIAINDHYDAMILYTRPKRNAAYKTYIVYGGLSPISRERFVTVWALILRVWVSGVVLAIIVTGRNWFSSLNLRFYRSWSRVIMRWRHECAWYDIVPICQKRYLRRSIILACHQNCWAITDSVTLVCNILIIFSLSTCVRFGIVN